MPGTLTRAPWLVLLEVSLLHSTLWSLCGPPPQHLTEASPSSTSPAVVAPPSPPCHPMSLSPVGASLSLVGPSLHLTPVRRCCRIGSGRARALCQCCLTWAILSWRRLSSARVLLCPKFSYVIRTCPPSHVNGAAKEFDWVMREAPQSIIGGPLSEWSWLKASLPSSRGGINLRSASCCLPGLLVCLPDTGGEDAWA